MFILLVSGQEYDQVIMDIVSRILKKKDQLSTYALQAFYYGYIPLLIVLGVRSIDFRALTQGAPAQ